MSRKTERLQLELQGANDFYDVEKFNSNFEQLDAAVQTAAKTSAVASLEEFVGSQEAQGVKAGDSIVIANIIYLFKGGAVTNKGNYLSYAGKPIGEEPLIFEQAAARDPINSGEKLPVILGKIKKFFTDLKKVAFTGSYADLTGQPNLTLGGLGAAASGHKHSAADVTSGTLALARGGTGAVDAAAARTNFGLGVAAVKSVANNCTTTADGGVLDARQGKVLKDACDQINSNLGTLTTNGAVSKFTPQADGLYATYKVGADTVTKKLGNLPDITMTYSVGDGGGMNPAFSVGDIGDYNFMDISCSWGGYSTCLINGINSDGKSKTIADKSSKTHIDILPYVSFMASVWGSAGSSKMVIRIYAET